MAVALTLAGASLVVGPEVAAERATRTEAGVATCEWRVVPTPILARSARGADHGPGGQVLAVGDRLTGPGVIGGSMRWDGRKWTRVAVPPAAGADVYLTDVAFVGDTAIAVGGRVARSERP